jgi:uncharacterized protein (TIGR02453 family)
MPIFSARLFEFCRELATHNDREWFTAHKSQFEEDVKQPLQQFVKALGPEFAKVAPAFVADPKPVGGSIFRIYRDTRFSADKTPYKTHAAAQFRHRLASRDVHAPGYYLHLEPGGCFMGAGLWRPDPKVLRQLRTAIASQPERWKRVVEEAAFTHRFKRDTESVKRIPAGFDANSPVAEDLKRLSHVCSAKYEEAEILQEDFLSRFVEDCRLSAKWMAYLCEALGLPTA